MADFVSGKVQLQRKIIEFFANKIEEAGVKQRVYFHHEDSPAGELGIELVDNSDEQVIKFYDLKDFLSNMGGFLDDTDATAKNKEADVIRELLNNRFKVFKKANADAINRAVGEDTLCPYCLEVSDSTDPRVLCEECRETFGHTFINEL